MKYAVEIGSDAEIHMRSFIKVGSSIQRWGGYTDSKVNLFLCLIN
jgi:hypothetical protein